MKKSINILAIIFLLFAFCALADTTYIEAGQADGYFRGNNTYFSTTQGFLTTNYNSYTKALVAGAGVPLVDDLNSDGINEVVVVDNGQVKLYNSKELTLLTVYNIPTTERYSNFVVYDVDGDGYKEIVFVRELSHDIIFLNYNGSSFFNKTSITVPSGINNFTQNGEAMIKCVAPGECLLVVSKNITNIATSAENWVYAISFNTTGIQNNIRIEYSAGGTELRNYCMPAIRDIQYQDYDGDGNKEYIFSLANTKNGGGTSFTIHYIQNVHNVITDEGGVNVSLGSGVLFTTYLGCSYENIVTGSPIADYFTSPLVMPFQDNDPNNGMETIIGAAKDNNEFKLYSYKPNKQLLSEYPNSQEADGILLSNPIKINAFPVNKGSISDYQTDVCVMGYQKMIGQIDLLCASEQYQFEGSLLGIPLYFNNIEYLINNITDFNISTGYGNKTSIIHSIKAITNLTNGNNMDEVVTPYGILNFVMLSYDSEDDITCRANSQCRLERLWSNPKGDGVLIPIDLEKVGYDDLLLLRPNNIWYFDDKYSNSPPTITSYTINPCINSVWKINGSVAITITPSDPDGDLVAARAVLYRGDANEMDSNWTANFTTSTSIPFTFMLNKSITTGTLRIYATDNFAPVTHATYSDLTFSVGDSGVAFGDCVTDFTNTTTPGSNGSLTLPANWRATNQQSNVVTDALRSADENWKLHLGLTVIWLFVMLISAGVVIYFVAKTASRQHITIDPKITLAVVGVVEVIEFMLGVAFGYFTFTYILIFIIGGVVIGGLWLKSKADGGQP